MQTEQILAWLIAERDRISRAIDALQGPANRRGRPPGSGRHAARGVTTAPAKTPARRKRKLSAAGRKAIVAAAKKRWALIRAGKAASPVAKAKRK